MEPALKVMDFMLEQALQKPFDDFHHGILRIIFINKVLQADAIDEVGISLEKDGDHFGIPGIPVFEDQFMVCKVMKVSIPLILPEP
jgi:hypothetical protein